MNKIKDIIVNNKLIAGLSAGIVVIGMLMVIVFSFGGKEDDNNKTSEKENTDISKENTSEQYTTENVTTSEKQTEETKTTESEETTTEEQTTQEQTTVPAITVNYPYIIKVNRVANCTTVYGKDASGNYTVPVKAITVSCGKVIEDTPLGEFNTIISYDWRLMFDGTYGHYAYRIVGSTLFHSVPYYTASNDDLEWIEYNKLGSPASMGCVRMTVADAKWLVDNCPVGTKVIIYDDASNPGPLGKPETIKLPANSPHKGWDPTDPNPNNPWHNYSATITYPSSKCVTVEEGSKDIKLRSYFSAKDTCGNDISDKIIISGKFNLEVPGTYNDVKISVTDAIGSYAEVYVTVVVKEKEVITTTKLPVTTESETTSKIEQTTEAETTTINETTTENETIIEDVTEKDEETTSKMENDTQ